MDLTEFSRQAHRGARYATGRLRPEEPDPLEHLVAVLQQLWDALVEIMDALIEAITRAAQAIAGLAESLREQRRPPFPGIEQSFGHLGRRHHQRGA